MIVSGLLLLNEFGNGFVNLENNITIYVPKANLGYGHHNASVDVDYDEKTNVGHVVKCDILGKQFVGQVHHFFNNKVFVSVEAFGRLRLLQIDDANLLPRFQKKDWILMTIVSAQNDIITAKFLKKLNDIDEIIEEMYTSKSHIENIENIEREDMTSLHVFTVDPPNTIDCDDAFTVLDDVILVHIADPTVSLDSLTQFNTIYGQNRHWPMLTNEHQYSILPSCRVPAITFRYRYNLQTKHVVFEKFTFSLIQSSRQYTYAEVDVSTEPFKGLFETSQIIAESFQGQIDCESNTVDSIDAKNMVKYWMQRVNHDMAIYMNKFPQTVYRVHPPPMSSKISVLYRLFQCDLSTLSEAYSTRMKSDISTFEKQALSYVMIRSQSRAYYETNETNETNDKSPKYMKHFALNIDQYLHITSPIRRASDLVNLYILKGGCVSNIANMISCMNEWEKKQNDVEMMLERSHFQKWYEQKGHNLHSINTIVIGVTPVGVSLFVDEIFTSITVHISKVTSHRLVYNAEKCQWQDQQGTRKFGEWDKLSISPHLFF